MNLKTPAIRSKKYLAGSRGARCTLRIPGVCNGDWSTTVPAHVRDRHTGQGVKASDLCVVDACFACHSKFDGRDGAPLPREQWLAFALRGLQETIESRVVLGLLFVSQDMVTQSRDRPSPPRRPPSERAKIPAGKPLQSRSNWPKGRKIPSRSTGAEERDTE